MTLKRRSDASSFDGAHQDSAISEEKKVILFVCENNTGLSQMAQAFAEEHGMKALSAGKYPAAVLSPVVVQAMKEKNIDLSEKRPTPLTPQIINDASLVVTIGCSLKGACPLTILREMQERTIDWDWKGLKGRCIREVREIRDGIERRVVELSRDNKLTTRAPALIQVK